MTPKENNTITVEVTVQAPGSKTWNYWTNPVHITHWNFASEDWHCPTAENDIRPGGRLSWRMEAKDGSFGFDFAGVYEKITPQKLIRYQLDDGRKVSINFSELKGSTIVTEVFEMEDVNSAELQKNGWQAILDNFRKYVENENKNIVTKSESI